MILERFIVRGGDNYNYLLVCEKTKLAAVIDPLEPEVLLSLAEQKGYQIAYILNTHRHADHTGGNEAIKDATGAQILAHRGVAGADRFLRDNAKIIIGRIEIKVLFTPGHTPDSVCFLTENKIFTGDTLFLAGVGRCFGEDIVKLQASLIKKIFPLAADTRIYAGHEYAERNLSFARSIEPENSVVIAKLNEVRLREMTLSTIGEEWEYNPFFRFADKTFQKNLQLRLGVKKLSERETFVQTRELRNNW